MCKERKTFPFLLIQILNQYQPKCPHHQNPRHQRQCLPKLLNQIHNQYLQTQLQSLIIINKLIKPKETKQQVNLNLHHHQFPHLFAPLVINRIQSHSRTCRQVVATHASSPHPRNCRNYFVGVQASSNKLTCLQSCVIKLYSSAQALNTTQASLVTNKCNVGAVINLGSVMYLRVLESIYT